MDKDLKFVSDCWFLQYRYRVSHNELKGSARREFPRYFIRERSTRGVGISLKWKREETSSVVESMKSERNLKGGKSERCRAIGELAFVSSERAYYFSAISFSHPLFITVPLYTFSLPIF